MEKRDFFTRWRESHKLSCDVLRAFPPESLGREIIKGMRPPGELFCHVYVHVNAVFNACLTHELSTEQLEAMPADIDYADGEALLRFAHRVMDNVFAHAGRTPDAWRQTVHATWGEIPMERLCLDAFAHEVHHRGQLSVMLRQLGINPPTICGHEIP